MNGFCFDICRDSTETLGTCFDLFGDPSFLSQTVTPFDNCCPCVRLFVLSCVDFGPPLTLRPRHWRPASDFSIGLIPCFFSTFFPSYVSLHENLGSYYPASNDLFIFIDLLPTATSLWLNHNDCGKSGDLPLNFPPLSSSWIWTIQCRKWRD